MHLTESIGITLTGLNRKPFSVEVPRNIGQEVQKLLLRRLKELSEEEQNRTSLPADLVFPGLFNTPKGAGSALRGLRYREELTQKQLAKKLGVLPHHISEMEHGKRPIGKVLAKKIGKALKADWRIFL